MFRSGDKMIIVHQDWLAVSLHVLLVIGKVLPGTLARYD
jgi:hypothetical protein